MTDLAEPAAVVDNRGKSCANGIVEVQRALEDGNEGDLVVVRSTDRRARREYPRLAAETPHELLDVEAERTGLVRREYTVYIEIHE